MNIENYMPQIITGLITVFVTIITKYLIPYLKNKAMKSKSEAIKKATGVLDNIVRYVVIDMGETIVKDVKSKSKDGKLDKKEAIEIKKNAVNRVLELTDDSIIKLLGKDGKNINKFIESLIETNVVYNKTDF